MVSPGDVEPAPPGCPASTFEAEASNILSPLLLHLILHLRGHCFYRLLDVIYPSCLASSFVYGAGRISGVDPLDCSAMRAWMSIIAATFLLEHGSLLKPCIACRETNDVGQDRFE